MRIALALSTKNRVELTERSLATIGDDVDLFWFDGSTEQAVATAMAAGIRAASGNDVPAISAGNYGGALGKFHFHLRQVLTST